MSFFIGAEEVKISERFGTDAPRYGYGKQAAKETRPQHPMKGLGDACLEQLKITN
jgi:hypothetical protein